MQDHLSRVVGLEGLVVTQLNEVGDQLDLEVELVARATLCPHCACPTLDVKERPVVAVRDLPLCGRRTRLLWRKRRYRCEGCGRTHTESHPELPPRQRVTARLRRHLFCRVREGQAHAEVAREERMTRYQVQRAFRAGADGEFEQRKEGLPRRISLDEAAHGKGVRGLVTVVSEPDRRRVIDLVEGRDRRTIERYLRSLPEKRRAAIEQVAIDPWEAYRQAVRNVLPRAQIVCDPFHLVRGANIALDTVRRERQRAEKASRRPTGARQSQRRNLPLVLYRSRLRLAKARQRLTESERRKLAELFAREPLIAEAWGLKECFRSIYRARDRSEAVLRLERFLGAVERAQIPSFSAFARGIELWREELLAYFDEPLTNGYAEGVINKVKVIKRRAYGLPSFSSFRERVLLACG
jgi:transposase